MDAKKKIAGKMESKSYTNTRCGSCGKFGHSHEIHVQEKKILAGEKSMVRDRHARMKKEGYSNERDYFEHTNPFKK